MPVQLLHAPAATSTSALPSYDGLSSQNKASLSQVAFVDICYSKEKNERYPVKEGDG